jgi:hypothetical protein
MKLFYCLKVFNEKSLSFKVIEMYIQELYSRYFSEKRICKIRIEVQVFNSLNVK